MPYKICPKCNEQNGVRSHECKKCGEKFEIKKEKSVDKNAAALEKIEAQYARGSWISDKPHKGMPKLSDPEPQNNDLNLTEIRDIISYEGLGWSIHHYIQPSQITDPKLREMWIEAKNKMIEITIYIEDNS